MNAAGKSALCERVKVMDTRAEVTKKNIAIYVRLHEAENPVVIAQQLLVLAENSTGPLGRVYLYTDQPEDSGGLLAIAALIERNRVDAVIVQHQKHLIPSLYAFGAGIFLHIFHAHMTVIITPHACFECQSFEGWKRFHQSLRDEK